MAGLNTTLASQGASVSSLEYNGGFVEFYLGNAGDNLTALSGSVGTLNTTLTDQGATISNLTSSLNGLTASVASNTNSLTSVNSTVGGLSTNVSSLTNLVNGLNATVNTLSAAGSTAVFVDAETPTGTSNGTNVTFSLANTPAPSSSLSLYRNGLELSQGIDYTLAGSVITFVAASLPQTGDILSAFYRMAGTGSTTNFTDAEIPGGTINGANVNFTLASSPNPTTSLRLYRNGLLLVPNVEYTLSGSAITFTSARTPQSGDAIAAYYRALIPLCIQIFS